MSDAVFSDPCKSVRHLFLDLEDTVITPVLDGWFNTHVINVQKVKDIIAEFKPDHVHIFSFAIWNEFERNAFNLGTRPMLEQVLGVKFESVPTVDGEIKAAACKILNISVDAVSFTDMSDFWGKHEAFRLNMRHLFKNNTQPVEVMFLDDAVFNEEFFWPDVNVKGRIVNIDQSASFYKVPEATRSAQLLHQLKDFTHFDCVKLEQTGELYFRLDTDDNTIKENESAVYFIEEELNQLGFSLIERYIEHDCITGYIVCL